MKVYPKIFYIPIILSGAMLFSCANGSSYKLETPPLGIRIKKETAIAMFEYSNDSIVDVDTARTNAATPISAECDWDFSNTTNEESKEVLFKQVIPYFLCQTEKIEILKHHQVNENPNVTIVPLCKNELIERYECLSTKFYISNSNLLTIHYYNNGFETIRWVGLNIDDDIYPVTGLNTYIKYVFNNSAIAQDVYATGVIVAKYIYPEVIEK